jgi:selenocysteine-specific elongation factor
MTDAPLTLGTAGHIDHGKSALIRALTGIDTDRLPEEHARGISIELGYARLELPSGRSLSIVDAPGHERYVRTMVAGATGIDLYLMAIAADDGVMPQTREHAAVLRALDVRRGVVAVTKSDLADPELAMLEATELLPGAEVVAVSARSGRGLDELRAALDRVAATVAGRADGTGGARLHVDRVFTIRGAGTVVTGTLWAGQIARGDVLELLPSRRRARAREVQVHDRAVEQAAAGQRVAINLSGLAVADISRGEVVIAAGGQLRETYLIDAELEFESESESQSESDDRRGRPRPRSREPESGARVQVHHGTRESPARLAWLGGRYWQLRLEQPLVPAAGDRLVVRQIAPPDTLGGGVVLDPHPRKHGPSRAVTERLARLSRGESAGADDRDAATPPAGSPRPAPLVEPTPLGVSALELERRLRDAGFEPPLDSELDRDDLAALRAAGRAVRVSQSLHYHPEALEQVKARVIAAAGRHGGSVTLAQLRDELGTSRKFAQALLEHMDAERVTIRRGDEHFLRRGVTGGG